MFKANAEARAVEMRPGVFRRTLTQTAHMSIHEITLMPGAGVELHSHPHEQIGYVARGRLRFRIGDEERVLGPGDGYAIPGGVVHGAWTEGDEPCVAIDIFHPVREEYLDH